MSATRAAGRTTQVAQAYAHIHRRIVDNAYPPGHQATEVELAEELGMSRTPVREALVRLQQEGLIELRPRHGMRVVPLSPEDMRDIYEVLTCLEAAAAERLARSRPSDERLRPMSRAIEAMERCLDRDDLEGWAAADEAFHRTLLELCGNARLARAANTFWAQAHRARLVSLRLRSRPTRSNAEHRALLDAIRDGAAGRARRIHEQHRRRAARELLGVLERLRLTAL